MRRAPARLRPTRCRPRQSRPREAPRAARRPQTSAWAAAHSPALAEVARSPYLLGIAAWVSLLSFGGTILYYEQANIVAATIPDRAAQTRLFATIDLAVSLLTLATQTFATGKLIARIGVGRAAAVLPGLYVIGFAVLALVPGLAVILVLQVLQRTMNFAIANPARQVFYTVVSREEKYKAKNLIDVVVFRGSDALYGWVFDSLQAIGLKLAGIALLSLPVVLAWTLLSTKLGRMHERRAVEHRRAGGIATIMSLRHSASRRRVLVNAAALALASALPPRALAQADAGAMLLRPIPSSGERIPVVGLGTASVFNVGSDAAKRATLAQVVRTLLDGGARLVDTASTYGSAEDVLGDLMAAGKLRSRVFVATKLEGPDAAELKRSLQLLRTESVDLLQLHNVRSGRQSLARFREWKARGICRYVGITSTYHGDFPALEEVLRRERPDFVQFDYSVDNREAEKRLLPAAGGAPGGGAHGLALRARAPLPCRARQGPARLGARDRRAKLGAVLPQVPARRPARDRGDSRHGRSRAHGGQPGRRTRTPARCGHARADGEARREPVGRRRLSEEWCPGSSFRTSGAEVRQGGPWRCARRGVAPRCAPPTR